MADGSLTAAYVVLGVYIALVLGCGILGAFITWFYQGAAPKQGLVREHFMAGAGLSLLVWFFSMAASLFSGYSISGIVTEAATRGFLAVRWIPAGVGVYVGFMVLGPRCHALGKQRGYMTASELIFDRFLPPAGSIWVAHALRLLTFTFLQLPVFTYLITQFRSVGLEVAAFTDGAISNLTAVLVAGGVLLLCDLMGGMRAVAYSDVLQGMVLFIGSIVFLVIQRTELGGLPAAWGYWSDPANLALPRVPGLQLLPSKVDTVSFFDFVVKTTLAATTYPHLFQRLFCARDENVMKRGLGAMNLTFFVVQLSSMLTGWVAVAALANVLKPGGNVFATTLRVVAAEGTGQAVAAALLLASGICAMMSTADSALLALSTMWVRDLFKPYIWPRAQEGVQLLFGKVVAIAGLSIGIALALVNIRQGKPDLSALFSLQSVTPIHVVPALWLGLHWRGLRGEAVLAGMVAGAPVTLGLVFSSQNVKRAAGDDMLSNGLSAAVVGFCVNLVVTVVAGLCYQFGPQLLQRRGSSGSGVPHHRYLDIGLAYDRLVSPWLVLPIGLMLLFTVPFYWGTPSKPNAWVGNISAWAFASLLISGVLAVVAAAAYVLLWQTYTPLLPAELPSDTCDRVDPRDGSIVDAKDAAKGNETELVASPATL